MNDKTLIWQYIGIICCVVILLVSAVVCSFAYAVDDVSSVALAYDPSSTIHSFTVDGDWEVAIPRSQDLTSLTLVSFTDDIYPYLPEYLTSSINKREISVLGYSFNATFGVYNDIGDGGEDLFYLYDYPNLNSTQPVLNEWIHGDETNYIFNVNTISRDVDISYQLYKNTTNISINRSYFLNITSIKMIYSADYSVIDRLVDEGFDNGFNVGYEDGYEEGLDTGYLNGYNSGYTVGLDEGSGIGYDEGFDVGYDEGNSYGYNVGYNAGYNNGYFDAGQEGVDYSWQGLVSAIFDVPIRTLIGKWEDTNNDGTYELVGGLFNFYIPELELNLAPILLSLITLCVIIVILKFVFQFM